MTQLQVLRNGRTETTLDRPVNPDDYEAMSETLDNWLELNRWDRSLWHQFTITGVGATRLQEAHPSGR